MIIQRRAFAFRNNLNAVFVQSNRTGPSIVRSVSLVDDGSVHRIFPSHALGKAASLALRLGAISNSLTAPHNQPLNIVKLPTCSLSIGALLLRTPATIPIVIGTSKHISQV